MSEEDVVVAARFPFGRYAATPWYRSRREHVGNVEWPPSPWRLARALLCSAHRLGAGERADACAALVRRLALVAPRYELPRVREVVYAQWMPQLAFDDSPGASQRSENGHTLLAVEPERELVIVWPGLTLGADERELLARLLDATPYLGQSVSLCRLRLAGERPPLDALAGAAVPREAAAELADLAGERTHVRLLAPAPEITRAELEVATGDGLVKAMAAPPGARWVEYVRVTPRAPASRPEPLVCAVVHRLEGVLRPAVGGPYHPDAGRRRSDRREPTLEQLLVRACGHVPAGAVVACADDDGDGRAERLTIRLAEPLPAWTLRSVIEPPRPLAGPQVDCALRLERLDWAADRPVLRAPRVDDARLVAFRVDSRRRPPLRDAIVVCETFRRRLLGVAGRRFGADAVPPRLSGRRADGRHLEEDHRHVHFLVAASAGDEIDRLAVWSPDGFSAAEAAVIRATTLPRLDGAPIELAPTSGDVFAQPARRFRSHTPFLPVRHPKLRGGELRDAPEDQVRAELCRRGLPEPVRVVAADGPWSSFRITRAARAGCFPELGRYGFEIELAEPAAGPIMLGRNSHFGMGLFLPADG